MSADTGFPLVFRIPDEILADIFLLNTNSSVEFWDRSTQEWGKDHDPGLTTRYSSQVCQRWREVALRYSTLWGRIIHYTEDPLPWIDELLRRTHQTTLELGQSRELGQLAYPKLSVLSRVMCHAQRLKTVNMLVEQATWQEICEGILQNRAPSLEYFHLSIRGTKMFTGTLFCDDAPCLRRLHLRCCLVNLTSPTLLNLTELSVASITFGAPTIDAWLGILGNMPFLCWLSIEKAISGPFPTCPFPNPHLPNLSCLAIDGDFRDCMALINHITYPPLRALGLKCVDVTSGSTLNHLLSMIEKSLSLWPLPAKTEHYFFLNCLEHNAFRMRNSIRLGGTWGIGKPEATDDPSLQYPVISIHLVFVNAEELESSFWDLRPEVKDGQLVFFVDSRD